MARCTGRSTQTLPDWLTLDEATGQLAGTPPKETDEPLALDLAVSDGTETASQPALLQILPFQAPLTASAWLKQSLNVVPWRAWLEQGVGFLVLWLVHLLGMNLLANLERGSLEESVLAPGPRGCANLCAETICILSAACQTDDVDGGRFAGSLAVPGRATPTLMRI